MMKKKEKKPENSERWLLTYSDLITLLMILFVVLYAISNVNQTEYEALSESLNGAMGNTGKNLNGSIILKGNGILDGGTGITADSNGGDKEAASEGSGEDYSIDESDGISREEFIKLRTSLYNATKNSNLKDKLRITVEDKGMVITLPNDILFDSGEADIKPEMRTVLDEIAQLLNSVDCPIQVEGHTDNIPVNNSEYTSNWQLSAERAANVVQYLVENYKIEPDRLAAIGYGEYKPVSSNKTVEGRMKNRRISITLLYNEEADQAQKE